MSKTISQSIRKMELENFKILNVPALFVHFLSP